MMVSPFSMVMVFKSFQVPVIGFDKFGTSLIDPALQELMRMQLNSKKYFSVDVMILVDELV